MNSEQNSPHGMAAKTDSIWAKPISWLFRQHPEVIVLLGVTLFLLQHIKIDSPKQIQAIITTFDKTLADHDKQHKEELLIIVTAYERLLKQQSK